MLTPMTLIRIGTRLVLGNPRNSVRRLGFVVTGVAFSMTIVLIALALNNALDERQRRLVERGEIPMGQHLSPSLADTGMVLRTVTRHHVNNQVVTLIAVANEGQNAPVLPGLNRIPDQHEVVVSPALHQALKDSSEASSAFRAIVQGQVVGELGSEALLYPTEWVAVAGYDSTILRMSGVAQEVRQPINHHSFQLPPRPLTQLLALILGLGGLLIPSLLLTATAIQVVAAERAEVLAGLRLIGATSRQIRWILGGEALIGGILGTLVALALTIILMLVAPFIPFGGGFFPKDLQLSFALLGSVSIIGPLLSVIVAFVAIRRVERAPLDVIRRAQWQTLSRKYLWMPFVGGVGLVAVVLAHDYLPELVLVASEFIFFIIFLMGLLIAGPIFVRTTAVLLGRFGLPISLWLAVQRVAENPRRGFRLVATILLSVFLFGFLRMTGPSTTALEAAKTTLRERYHADLVVDLRGARLQGLATQLAAIPGVRVAAPYGFGNWQVNGTRWNLTVGNCQLLPHVLNLSIEGTCTNRSVFARSNLIPTTLPTLSEILLIERSSVQQPSEKLSITLSGEFSPSFADGSQLLVAPEVMGPDWQPVYILLKTDGQPQTYQAVLETVVMHTPSATVGSPTEMRNSAEVDNFQNMLSIFMGLAVVISCISLGQSLLGNFVESGHLIAGLRAIGMQQRQLKHLFIGEMMFLLVLAFGLGLLLAILLGSAVAVAVGNPLHVPLGSIIVWLIGIGAGGFLFFALLWKVWIHDQTRLLAKDDIPPGQHS